MTTTTGNAGPVLEHLEFYAQTVWPELHVHLTSVSDQWAGMALAGPNSRAVLGELIGEEAASNSNLPYMGYLQSEIDGVRVRIFRVSFLVSWATKFTFHQNLRSMCGNLFYPRAGNGISHLTDWKR